MDSSQITRNCFACFEKQSCCIGHAENSGVTFVIDANNLASDHRVHLTCIACFQRLHAQHGNAIPCPLCRTILTGVPGILARFAATSLSNAPVSNNPTPPSYIATVTAHISQASHHQEPRFLEEPTALSHLNEFASNNITTHFHVASERPRISQVYPREPALVRRAVVSPSNEPLSNHPRPPSPVATVGIRVSRAEYFRENPSIASLPQTELNLRDALDGTRYSIIATSGIEGSEEEI